MQSVCLQWKSVDLHRRTKPKLRRKCMARINRRSVSAFLYCQCTVWCKYIHAVKNRLSLPSSTSNIACAILKFTWSGIGARLGESACWRDTAECWRFSTYFIKIIWNRVELNFFYYFFSPHVWHVVLCHRNALKQNTGSVVWSFQTTPVLHKAIWKYISLNFDIL